MKSKKEPQKTQDQKSSRLPIFMRLIRRMVIFLTLTDCFLIMLYGAGNYQGFLDSNLNFLLNSICANSIALFFFSAAATAESIRQLAKQKKSRFILHLLAFTFVTLLSIALAFLSLSINILSEGFSF